ncbi:DUF1028 domain-containing protein [Halorubrum tibetense]|uniref:DUF1028 domain-containing protein n=1 Tax=Halorubrum tibetense TaxID=175631 RepID=A0ABD5S9N9_9EURY
MTFSIVAHDPETEAVGVAVQSKFVSVGSVVPFAAADAGAIATQSFANVAYGPDGLDLLREGYTAAEAIDALVEDDEEAASRQVGVVGADGSIAAYTGDDCLDVAGDQQGETYTVQGNILENEATLTAMAEAYESEDGDLPERLLAALFAGDEAGGDSRGKQSAALYVAKPDGGYDGRNDRWIDVRVDDHEDPIAELERVFKLYDVTLLSRAEPDDPVSVDGDVAEAVTGTLAELGFVDGEPSASFGEAERDALESFRGVNNFENHSLAALEDAIAHGWPETDPAADGEARLIDAIWHGLGRLPRE